MIGIFGRLAGTFLTALLVFIVTAPSGANAADTIKIGSFLSVTGGASFLVSKYIKNIIILSQKKQVKKQSF